MVFKTVSTCIRLIARPVDATAINHNVAVAQSLMTGVSKHRGVRVMGGLRGSPYLR